MTEYSIFVKLLLLISLYMKILYFPQIILIFFKDTYNLLFFFKKNEALQIWGSKSIASFFKVVEPLLRASQHLSFFNQNYWTDIFRLWIGSGASNLHKLDSMQLNILKYACLQNPCLFCNLPSMSPDWVTCSICESSFVYYKIHVFFVTRRLESQLQTLI